MRSRLALLIVVALLCVTLSPAAARGDADPASDVLLGQSVFYPYSPPVSQAIQNQLNAEVAAAGRAHFPIKVALIGSPVDLGALPNMFGNPQNYATFLDQEITFNGPKQPLLVVMPGGYGVAGLPQPAMAAAASLPKAAGGQPDDLARAASVALSRLAGAAGVHVSASAQAGSSGASSNTVLAIAIVAVVAVLAAGGVLIVRRRRRPARLGVGSATTPTRSRSAPAAPQRPARRRQR